MQIDWILNWLTLFSNTRSVMLLIGMSMKGLIIKFISTGNKLITEQVRNDDAMKIEAGIKIKNATTDQLWHLLLKQNYFNISFGTSFSSKYL
jgi:hypothetical protein